MTEERHTADVEFCSDSDLGYERSRTRFVPGEGLSLDERYRLAHLPLVAPGHPAIIPTRAGTDYNHGRHSRVSSLVVPVPWRDLFAANSFRKLEHDLKMSALAPKIAWDLVERRRERLHATLCGAPVILEPQRRQLAEIGPITVELRGLFSGNVNIGRLYLRAYPERRNGANPFHRIQRILGRPETSLYLVGLFNLTDQLTATEAAALAALIDRWWHRPILRFEVAGLWLLWALDDLVLEGGVEEVVPLAG
jgi:hypothetical protein